MKFIEQGWQRYRHMVLPACPPIADDMARQAYFAGAAVLHQTIMNALSPGAGETPGDLRVMAYLQAEIDRFGAALDRRVLFGDDKAMEAMKVEGDTLTVSLKCPKCGYKTAVTANVAKVPGGTQ